MTNETLRRAIGGVFFAITDALDCNARERANQSLREFAQDNSDDPATADLCRSLAEYATDPLASAMPPKARVN